MYDKCPTAKRVRSSLRNSRVEHWKQAASAGSSVLGEPCSYAELESESEVIVGTAVLLPGVLASQVSRTY